jgi:hypothetical protein
VGVVIGAYREFFEAVAASAAALTGLLFVAMSVAPRRHPAAVQNVIQQVRAAAALVAFVSPLAISLFALVPGNTAKYPAAIIGAGGILFTAASVKSIFSSPSTTTAQRLGQLPLIGLLLLIFGTELAVGILLLVNSRRGTPVEVLSDALVASLLVGISRAWELVGDRDTGILSSIILLARHAPGPPPAAGIRAAGAAGTGAARTQAGATEAGDAPGPEPGDQEADPQ